MSDEAQVTLTPNGDYLTLRDHFAGLAMQGNIASDLDLSDYTDECLDDAAVAAYRMADAMLRARAG